jgi:hypothetical protein
VPRNQVDHRGFTGSQLLRPVRLLAPLGGSDWVTSPATGDFYFQASDGSVALPATCDHSASAVVHFI